MTDPARLSMLLAQARSQAADAQDDLAVMRAHFPRPLVLGLALQSLIEQLRRIRSHADKMPHGVTPADLRAKICSELLEVEVETDGSDRAKAESLDVLAASLHHAIAQGVDPLVGIAKVAAKLARRCDVMDLGLTWAEAKAEERKQ
jgi:hypothetical protein